MVVESVHSSATHRGSSPKDAPGLTGNHENIEVGKFIAEYLDVDLEPVTKELKEKGVKQGSPGSADDANVAPGSGWDEWMGPPGLPNNVFNFGGGLFDLIVEIEEAGTRGESEWFFIQTEIGKYIHIPLSFDILERSCQGVSCTSGN